MYSDGITDMNSNMKSNMNRNEIRNKNKKRDDQGCGKRTYLTGIKSDRPLWDCKE